MNEEKRSVISLDMIEAWAEYYEISLEDGSQYPGVVGSLKSAELGVGSLPAELVNGNPIFDDLRVAYAKANGYEEPESWQVPLTPLDEGVTDIMEEVPEGVENVEVEDEKLPEAGEITE